MKPAPFRYARPKSLAEALSLLAAARGEAKLLAGGQSLVPMLNMRLVRPAVLVDLNAVPGLDGIAKLPEAHVGRHAGHRGGPPRASLAVHAARCQGCRRGGAIPGPAAVANAVEDALAPFGAVIRSLPITPERVWRLMRTAP